MADWRVNSGGALVISVLVIFNQLPCTFGQDQQGNVPSSQKATAGQKLVQLVATTAQEFVDAVRNLEEGVDTIINIPSGVVVNLTEGVVLPTLPAAGTIDTGSLTIRGGVNGTQPSVQPVLHLGWKAGVAASAIVNMHACMGLF